MLDFGKTWASLSLPLAEVTMSRPVVLVLASVGAALAAGAQGEDRIDRERQRLAGTWRVIGVEVGGVAVPRQQYRDLTLTFKGGVFTARLGDQEAQAGTCTIEPSRNPKEMDIARTNGPVPGRRQVAIYEVSGNALKICSTQAGQERPGAFDTRDHPSYTLMTLRRVP